MRPPGPVTSTCIPLTLVAEVVADGLYRVPEGRVARVAVQAREDQRSLAIRRVLDAGAVDGLGAALEPCLALRDRRLVGGRERRVRAVDDDDGRPPGVGEVLLLQGVGALALDGVGETLGGVVGGHALELRSHGEGAGDDDPDRDHDPRMFASDGPGDNPAHGWVSSRRATCRGASSRGVIILAPATMRRGSRHRGESGTIDYVVSPAGREWVCRRLRVSTGSRLRPLDGSSGSRIVKEWPHVRTLHRTRQAGRGPRPRRGPIPQAQLHRHRAPAARPAPRGGGRGRARPRRSRSLRRGGPRRRGPHRRLRRGVAAGPDPLHAARQEGPRAGAA